MRGLLCIPQPSPDSCYNRIHQSIGTSSMKRVRHFEARVTYQPPEGGEREETFPVQVEDYETAKSLALLYVLHILKLQDFELRIAGA